MKKIKVLHILDKLSVGGSSIHGVGRLFSWWIPRFDKNRFNVQICIVAKRDAAGEWLESHGISITYLAKRKFDPTQLGAMSRIISETEPDVLHLHGYRATTLGRCIARQKMIPCIIHEHCVEKYPLYMNIPDLFLRNTAAAALAVSGAVKDFMVQKRHLPEKKVSVFLNAVPLDEFHPVDRTHLYQLRKELGIDDQTIVVGNIGRLDEQKALDDLIYAAELVHKQRQNVIFLIAGDGPQQGYLKCLISDLKLADTVRLLGFRTDVAALLTLFDIFVICSREEGFALSALEAMAVGNALIATDAPGLREMFEHEKNALVVPYHDANMLSDALLRLLNDKGLRRILEENAKEDVQQYSMDHYVTNLQDLYSTLEDGQRFG